MFLFEYFLIIMTIETLLHFSFKGLERNTKTMKYIKFKLELIKLKFKIKTQMNQKFNKKFQDKT